MKEDKGKLSMENIQINKERLEKWLDIIASKKIEHDQMEVAFHIVKHIAEFKRMVIKERRIDDWINSMLNIIFIYRKVKKEDPLNYNGMLERLENHAQKEIPFNIQEDGTIKET